MHKWFDCNETIFDISEPFKENHSFQNQVVKLKMAFQKLCSYELREFLAMLAQFTMLMVMIWTTALSITDRLALPGGHIFSLIILFTSAVAGGYIFSRIYLPPLLGMLYIMAKEYLCSFILLFFQSYTYKNSYLVKIWLPNLFCRTLYVLFL